MTRVYSVTVTDDDALWVATREGALHWLRGSLDEGAWEHVENGLPAREVTWISQQGTWLLAAVAESRNLYVSVDRGQSWKTCESAPPFEVAGATLQGNRLYLISRNHGILLRELQVRADAHCAESIAAR